MALINTLRNKMGKLIVVAVSLAIASFVLADLLGPNSAIMGDNKREVGQIGSKTISQEEYQLEIDRLEADYSINNQRTPTETEMIGIRNSAWDALVDKIILTKEFESLGIEVTEEEKADIIYGDNILPEIKQAFSNPQTGSFDKNTLLNYLSTVKERPVEQQRAWYNYEAKVVPGREKSKYEALINFSDYATEEEARLEYVQKTTMADVKYLYVKYNDIPDSLFDATDEELKAYLKEYAYEYDVTESYDIKYVTFPIEASNEDIVYIKEELEDIKGEFEIVKAENDSSFASMQTEGSEPYKSYTVDALPSQISNQIDNLSAGSVIGPIKVGDMFSLYKLSSIDEGDEGAARASHILIKTEESMSDDDKEDARRRANDILKKANLGLDFAALAEEFSEGPTASNGGDLGWFSTGKMVKPFEDAVFEATKIGVINRLVETQFGFHIINVTELPNKTSYKVAKIDVEITPSDATRDNAYRKADLFASSTNNNVDFLTNAEKDSLEVQEGEKISKNANRVGRLGGARELIRWIYNDGSVNDVSPVYEVEEAYVVALVTKHTEEGTADLEEVRDQITSKVINKKKAKQIVKSLNGLEGTLEEKATTYDDQETAKIYTGEGLILTANSLTNVGFAPVAIGKIFGLEVGQQSEAFEENNGVLILKVTARNEAPEVADYNSYKQDVKRKLGTRNSFNIKEAIKEFAEIKDWRYKFY